MIELTIEEFYTLCITIAACTWLIQSAAHRFTAKKKQHPKRNRSTQRFTQKKWTPNGWYFDEKKKRWIAPDFPKKEE